MRIPFRLIGGVLVATLLTQVTACGSIFYPDRRGQIDGKIDPAIAVLDAVGLLFYIIPGLIAFAVDFATGAIYFEPGKTAQVDPEKLKDAIGADGRSITSSCRLFCSVNWAAASRWMIHA